MRYERLRKIEEDLKTRNRTQRELAEKYNVNISTICRDLRDLSCIIPVVQNGREYYVNK
jgi:Trp operon repressor